MVVLSLATGLFKDRSYAQPVTLAVAIPVGLQQFRIVVDRA